MKLSYRDRIILLVVLVLLILVLGGVLLVKPQWTKLKENKVKRTNLETEWNQQLIQFDTINTMRDNITTRRDEAYDISQNFTDEMDAMELDKFMQETFLNVDEQYKKDNVQIRGTATITGGSTTSLGYYYYSPDVVTYPLYEGADFDGSLQKEIEKMREEATALSARPAETVGVGNVELTLNINREDTMKFIDSVYDYAKKNNDAMLIQSVTLKDYDFNGQPVGQAAEVQTDEEGNPIAPQQTANNVEEGVTPGYTEATFKYQVFYMQEPTEVENSIGDPYDASMWDKEWETYQSKYVSAGADTAEQ